MSRPRGKQKAATLTLKRLPMSKLKPHPRNPRVHPDPGTPEWDTLKRSLAQDYFDPIVFNTRNGMLVSGHLRVKVMRAENYTHADAVVVDYDDNTHLARMIAANKSIGEDNRAALKDLLQELDTGAMDMAVTGYAETEIEDLMTQYYTGNEETPMLPVDTTKPPKMAWALIGVPLHSWAEIAELIKRASSVDGSILETSANDGYED